MRCAGFSWRGWGRLVGKWVCFDGVGRGGSGACAILRAVPGGGDFRVVGVVNVSFLRSI